MRALAPALLAAVALLGCGAVGPATAGDAGAPGPDAAPDAGSSADGGDGGAAGDGATDDGGLDDSCLGEDEFAQALRHRAEALEARARELDEREHSLGQLGRAIDERLASLERTTALAEAEIERLSDEREGRCRERVAEIRAEYQDLERGLERWEAAQRESSEERRRTDLDRLATSLRSMRPDAAAAAVGELDDETAALLLSRLPERSNGQILAAMTPSRAAAVVRAILARSRAADREALRQEGGEGTEGGAPAGAAPAGAAPGEATPAPGEAAR